LPNSTIITSTHTAKLPFPQLPTKAIEAHIFPHLQNHALLSIGILCDSGCSVTFTQEHIQVQYNNQIVLEGTCIPPGLWTIDIPAPQQANATYSAPLKATALQHVHASLFSPATQTWIKAVNNHHFTTWPPFTPKDISKLLPKSIATTLGHLDQQRKNIRSTKRKPRAKASEDTEGIDDTNPLRHHQRAWASPVSSTLMNHPTNPTQISQDGSPSIQARAVSTSLAQGVRGRVQGTNTITVIHHHEMPSDRQATYPRFICSERPQKQEKNRTRMTVGGNLINYPGDKSTKAAELETTTILLNSVLSTQDARFCTADITNFYLNTPLD
jgi:hypothetical protein